MKQLGRYLVAAALLLPACSRGMEGEYSDDSGMFTYAFKRNGKVEVTQNVLGMSQVSELEYRLEDGKVKLGPPGGPQQVISVDKDGCLNAGGLMGKLCKKKG